MANTDKPFVYGRTTAAERGAIENFEAPWSEIVELFRKPVRRNVTIAQYQAWPAKKRSQNKNTGLFFGGRCSDGQRKDSTLVSRSIVNLDLDDHCEAIWDHFSLIGEIPGLEGLTYLVHTTRSHTDEAPKLRILIPLAREVTPAEYEPVARALAKRLDEKMLACARESFTPAQGMYFPSVSVDQGYEFASVDGGLFNPDKALKLYPADDASTWPKAEREQVTEYVQGRRMMHPEEKKAQAPIIAATHRAFSPWDFIERFLGDVYLPSGERYYPVGSTGAPSVRIYDDAFIQSDHGSDPARGQHNTFDLGRIHLFGDLDRDFETDHLSPVDWPSYKAMENFMLEQQEVRAALEEVKSEVEDERNSSMMDLLDDFDDDPAPKKTKVTEDDDLIGAGTEEKERATIEDVLRRVRKTIRKAKSLDDLERRLEIIRAFPGTDFRDLHRDLVAADLQDKFRELAGDKISKLEARRMLSPTIQNLRDQAQGEDLPGWIKPWVYVSSENKFLHTLTKELLPREGFNGRLAVPVGERFGVSNNGISIIQPADAALSVFDIPKPYRTVFHPGREMLFDEDGIQVVNTYRSHAVPAGGYKGKKGVKLLNRLLADLFPSERDRALVMDWLVHIVRYPERKLKYALLIKGSENEGKSLLADLLASLLGAHNCSVIGNDQLKEKFNGWAYEKLLCVVEEIRMPGREAHEVLNKLKPVVTNNVLAIRRMNKDTQREPNYCNLYITTNYEDCLPMEEDNSRYLVLFTRFLTNASVKSWHADLLKEEGKIYTRELWEEIRERPAQFVEAFSQYEFSEWYDPDGRAPDTVFKQVMAEDAKTDERNLLEQMLESREDPTITPEVLIWSSFREVLDARNMAPSLRNRAIASFLKPLGFVKGKGFTMRIDGRVVKFNVWTRDTDLLDAEYNFNYKAKALIQEAVSEKDALSEVEFETGGKVVPITRNR